MEIVFFVDRNLGKQFLIMLRDRGLRAEVHDDHFAQGTTDVEWIPVVAKKQWIAVSMDDRIRYNPVEQAMVFGSGLRLLLLAGKPPLKLHAENVWRSMLAIERFVSRNAAPWIAKLYRPSGESARKRPAGSGRIEMWRSAAP